MTTPEPPPLGHLLRLLRTAAAFSQEELAERTGLSVRAISDLERGVHQAPRLETIRLLGGALGLGEAQRAELLTAARPEVIATVVERDRPAPVASLPMLPMRLIGREAEVTALGDLLAQSDSRLVTLTGAGGTGKTHLALAVAADVAHRYPDGVGFVDLSPLTDPALVLPAIATAIGARETAEVLLREALSQYLRERRLLLVLDNCEQVLATASDIAILLADCQDLVILATSRVPLHIRAEREFPLSPLPLPPSDRLPAIAELAQVPAVALFVERATASHPSFALTAENATAIAAICQRLDGLPLAIELAAARIKILSPADLLARLERRLPLLSDGPRDLPARQRTMRDAIAWSYDLLAPEEQALFRRLTVFAGGFTLAAAEAVAHAESALHLLDGVIALIEQSLLRQILGAGDEPRYQMLETVREFGLEQLTAAGEAEVARQRHADHFLSIAENVQYGSRMMESMTRLAPERDNVLVALTWFNERGNTDALLRLSALFYGIWLAPGPYREGLRWIDRALNRSSTIASTPRVQALAAAAYLTLFQGDYARAATYVAEGLALARALGDPLLVGRALHIAGLLSYRRGEYGQAEELLDEAHRLLRELGDSEPDAVWDAGLALLVLGDIALAQKRFARAGRRYQESLACYQAGSYLWGAIDARAGLAGANYCAGDLVQAAALYMESLDRAQERGMALLVASALLGLAGVAAASGQPERGANLLGATEGIMGSLGAPIFPRDRPVREHGLAVMAEALGEERLTLAFEAGRSLSVAEAVAQARAVGEMVMQSPP
jgi:predicted ATPase/transcriptional regulator with XRE-family HTH domain